MTPSARKKKRLLRCVEGFKDLGHPHKTQLVKDRATVVYTYFVKVMLCVNSVEKYLQISVRVIPLIPTSLIHTFILCEEFSRVQTTQDKNHISTAVGS